MSDQSEPGRRIDWLFFVSRWLPYTVLGICLAIGLAETALTGQTSFMQNGLTLITLGLGSLALMGLHVVLFAARLARETDTANGKLVGRFRILRFVPGFARYEPMKVRVWMLRLLGVVFVLFGILVSVLGLVRV